MNKRRKEIIAACEISRVISLPLGGHSQKILIEGRYADSPVVLFLHGGPGSPLPFNVGCRGLFPEFSEKFVMVYWDQLGCGINNRPLSDALSVNDFTDMTIDLVKALREMFPKNRLVLFGVSWGSVLAAKAAAALPALVDGVFVYGQMLKNAFMNPEVYGALSAANLPTGVRKRMDEIWAKKLHTIDDATKVSVWVRKYTEGYQVKTVEAMPLGEVIRGILASPDYSLKDFFALFVNGAQKSASLLEEMLRLDLSETLQQVQIPYMILQGDKDIVTSTQAIAAFAQSCGNSNISVSVIENSAHMPGKAAMDILFGRLLLLAKGKGQPEEETK